MVIISCLLLLKRSARSWVRLVAVLLAIISGGNLSAQITGNTTLSTAIQTQLSAAGGGTWESSATGVATVNSTTGLVTGVSAGTAVISYTLSGTTNTATVTVKTPGVGMNFDGTNDGVVISNDAALQIGTGTIEAWIKTSDAGSSYRAIVAKPYAYAILLNNNVFISYDWSTASIRSSGINLADNKWHHVAASFNSGVTNGSYLYIDGVQVLNYTFTVSTQLEPLTIGQDGPYGQNFAGNIDEVKIWNVQRSAAEILADMNCTAPQHSNMIGYYRFDEGVAGGTNTSLTSAIDYSGYSRCGTLSNMALTGSTSNFVTGSVGNCNTISVTAPGSITGNSLICGASGGTTTLANSATGGLWTSSATGVATVGSTSGIVSSASVGTAIITYTLFCQTATKVVTVTAAPAAITGNTTLSTAITTQLADATGGGTWSSSSTGVATVGSATGLVTGVSAGTSIISYTTTIGCSAIATVTVKTPGAGINLDGTNDVVYIDNSSAVQLNTGTIESWIKTGGAGSSDRAIVVKQYAYGLFLTSNVLTTFDWNTMSTRSTGVNLADNKWHHVALVFTSGATNGSFIYIDGQLALTTTITVSDQTHPLVVGQGSESTFQNFAGNIDEVRVWNTALSQAAIQANMNCDVAQNANLIAYFRFDEGAPSGTNTGQPTTIDYSGNGHCGTITTMALSGGSSNFVTGAIGGCNNISITTPAAIGGSSLICGTSGATTTLTNSSSGGTWASSATGVATVGTTGLVTSVSAGTTVITYSLNCQIATKVVTVAAAPAAITGNTTLSTIITTQLADVTGGGTWSSSATGVATVNSTTGLVTGVSAGTSTITYTTSSGCTAVATVTVKTPGVGLKFDGTGDYVGVPNNSAFETTTGTIETWLRIGWNSLGTSPCFISMRPTTISNTRYSFHITGDRNSIGLWNGSSYTTMPFAFAQNVWYHIAVVYSTTVCSVYVNGVYAGNITSGIQNVTGHNMRIGAPDDTYPAEFWIGDLDEVRIWNTQRTATEIANNTNCDVAQQAGLVGYYRFDEGIAGGTNTAQPQVIDYSGNGYCGTLNNFTLTGTSSNFATGAIGSCNAISISTPAAIGGSTAICGATGATTTLTNAAGGGRWSSSATGVATIGSSSGVVTSVSVGTTVITYSLNCQIATTVVTVNASPAAIGGSAGVCQSSATTLTNATGGGTWSSSATGVATIGSSTGILTAVSLGTTVVTYALSTGCYAIATSTVFALPAAITGNTTLSTTITTTLADATGGGTWSSSATGVATVGSTTGLVSGVSAGTATISYTLATGCNVNAVVTVKTPKVGLNLDGTNDRIDGTNASLPQGSAARTIEAWINMPSFAGHKTLFNWGTFANNQRTGLLIFSNNLYYVNESNDFNATSATFSANTWTHVAATMSGTSVNFYINGVLMQSGTLPSGAPNTTGTAWSIGNTTGSGTPRDMFNGSIDEVRVWNVVRTQSEIAANMNCDVSQQAGLVAYYRFDEGIASGTNTGQPNVMDYSGNGSCGALANFTLTGGSSNFVTGTVGSCNNISINTPAAITGTTIVCQSSTTTLTNAVAGGTWSSSATGVATVGTTGIVSGVSAGTAVITYNLNCQIATKVVTVAATPAAITGNTTLSTVITTLLADATAGGTWSSSATGVATVNSTSGLVTGVSAGTSTITYTTGAGCTAVTIVTVKTPGVGLNLDGAGDYVGILNNSAFETSTGTIEAWIKAGWNTVGINNPVFISMRPTVVTNARYSFHVLGDRSGFGLWNGSSFYTMPFAVAQNVWYHVAIVYSTSVCSLYVNGAYAGNINAGIGSATGNNIRIGAPDDGYPNEFWIGSLDEIRVWNTQRTATEIANNAKCDVAQQAGLVAYYRFDEGIAGGTNTAQPQVIDYSGNGYCGTLNSFTLTGTSSNFGTGAIGSCNTISITTPAAISGSSLICGTSGATTSLTNSSSGGTWTSSATGVATVGTTGLVTSVSAGTTVITYSLNCQIATKVVTVAAAPAAITGNTTLSTAITTQLADATAGGTWSSSATGVATVNSTSGLVTGVSAGTAIISYTVTSGCAVTTAVTVTTPLSCLIQDGTDDYVAAPGGVYFNGDLTLEAWVYPVSSYTNYGRIIDFGVGQNNDNVILSSSFGTTGFPRFYVFYGTSGQSEIGSSIQIPLNTWSHVAATLSGTTATIYVNGVAAGTTTFTAAPNNVTRPNCFIGKSNWTSDPYPNQKLDEVRIWNVARTQAQIQASMNCTIPQQAGLMAYYRFDEGVAGGSNVTQPQTIDYSGNNLCGTLNNFALTGTSSNFVTGAIGDCNTISINTPAAITGTTAVCVSSTTALANAVAGGAWSSSATGVATVGTTGIVSGVSAGTTVITYSLNCQIATKVVTVNANPAAITGNTTLSTAITTKLSDATGGGTWSSSATGVATVNSTSGLVTGVSAGTATITYSLASGCSVNTAVTVKNPNSGLNLDGVNDRIDGTNASLPQGSAARTIEAWIKMPSFGGLQFLFNWGTFASNQLTGLATYNNNLYYVNEGNDFDATSATLSTNTWTHVAATMSGTSLNFYVNGVLMQSGSLSGGAPNTTGTGWTIGNTTNYGSPRLMFNGSIDEVRIWNVVRTQSEIATNMNCDVSQQAGLVAYYRFDEGIASGTNTGQPNVMDYSGTGSCGALSNFTLTGGSSNFVTGAIGSCNTISISTPAAIGGTTAICGASGATTTLTNAAGGGRWSSSATGVATIGSSSGVVTSVSAGTTVITYSLNCQIATTVVTVNANPAAIGGSVSVCQSSSTTLTNATGGGTWSSSVTGVATIGSSTGILTAVSVGTTVVTYALSTGCYAIATSTVFAAPAAITGNTTLSTTITTQLDDATVGGVWSSSATGVATVGAAGLVTGVSAGTATISYTLGSVCSALAVVTVKTPKPGINFDGTNDAVVINNSAAVQLNTGTVESWIKTNGAGSAWRGIVVKQMAYGLLLQDNILGAYDWGANVGRLTGINVADNKWHHVAMAFTSGVTNGTFIYLDGQLVLTTTITVSDQLVPLVIGQTSASTMENFAGSIDEVRIWNTVLSQSTIQANMNCDVAQDANLVAYYRFDEGTPSGTNTGQPKVMDYSGNGHCGTLTSMALTGGSSNFVTGAVGSCNVIAINTPASITGASSVCQGATTTLTNAVAGGTWSSSATGVATVGTTGIVTGVSAGVAVITYNLNCQIATKAVTVNPIPAASITGATTVCVAATTALANATGGGAWSSSATGVATIGSTTGIATGVSAGTSNITYTLPAGCYTTTVVTVNPIPATITGTASACVGFTSTLSSATPSGNWSSSALGVATVGTLTGVVSAVSAGTATITYTRSNGCYTTATFTTNPLPAAIGGVGSVCAGFTTTYTNATGGGTWSSSATGTATVGSSTGVVTGVAAGSATITYTLGTGCYATAGVTVNAVPAAIGGTAKACVGFGTTLTNTVSGGTWTSGATGIATVGTGTGVVTAVSAGTATITYTRSNGCFATKEYTVNANPAAIGGTTNACLGFTSTLTNATGGGTWSSSASTIASVGSASGTVTGIAAASATITYTLGTGCYATSGFTVNANPATIGGTKVACEGFGTTLTNSVGGGTWTSANTGIATIGSTSGAVSGVSAGTTTITYTRSNGCYATTTYTVNTTPAAIGGTLNSCIGFSSTLTNATGGGTWTSASTGIATAGAGTGVVTGIVAGTANITYTLGTGCYASANYTVNANPASITGTTNVCTSGTTTLSDATGGGAWTVSNANATMGTGSGVVTGVTAGTAVVSYTLATGCYKTTNIIIYETPAAISGTSSLCAGGSTTLSNTVSGGVWSSSNTAVASVGSATGVVTGVAGGSATITYNTGGTCYATFATTIGAILPITGTPSACTGASSTLSCGSAGGTWSSGNTAVATIGSTGVMTGVSVGTSVITYALPSGCARYVTVYISDPGSSISGPSSVCIGQTITLTDAAAPGGAWTSSNGGIASVGLFTGVVTGRLASSATITYTLGSSCYITKTLTVNSFSSSYAAVTNVMVGNTITMGNAMSGGTWSSSATGIATVNSTSGVVTGVSAGTASISYTVASGCTDYINVTVNAAPSPISGPSAVCIGQSVTLTSGTPGGVWTSSNGGIALVGSSTGIVTGRLASTVNITYTVGGTYSVRTMTVTSFSPSYASVYTVMSGNTISMNNTTSGGTWSSTNTGVATVNSTSGLVTGVGAGTTIISYAVASGCSDGTTITVTSAPSAITGPSVVCFSQTATLSSATPGGVWSTSNGAIATVGSSTGIVTPLIAAPVNITYTVGSGYAVKSMTVANFSPVYASVTTINSGNTTAIFDATSGGVWSSSAPAIATVNSTTGVVTGVLSGTTMISYTMPTGCTDGIMVTVAPAPAIGAGPGQVCVGSTLTLTHATPGGVWTSSNGGIALVGSSTGIVTGRIAATCTITYTLPTSVYVTTTITVLPSAAISGQTKICNGQSLTLTNSIAGGTWYSSNGGVASAGSTTGVISGVSLGTSIISYVLPTGCYALKTVTVVTGMTSIIGTPEVCNGSSVTLTHAITGGAWSSSNTGVATAVMFGGSVTGVSAGTTTITYTIGPACKAWTTFTVDPVPAAIGGGNSVCVSTPITLTNATGGGVWSSLDPSIATVGSSDGLVTGVTSGFTTTISYTLPTTGCYAVNSMAVNPCRFAGDEELSTASVFTLIPNPNSGTFVLKGSYTSQTVEEASIEVVNTLGQSVYRKTINSVRGKIEEEIQLPGTLANGMYLLNLHTLAEQRVFHFVISK